jgi:hypothetical protein
MVQMTKFNRNRDSNDITLYPDLHVSAGLLNEALANVTFAVMYSMPFWSMDSQATTSGFRNVYSFSRPMNLVLPYALSLLLSIPLLLIGVLSLWRNGVPAADGGFVQLLMTTTGSQALREAAAGGCLYDHSSLRLSVFPSFPRSRRACCDANLCVSGVAMRMCRKP